MTRHGKNSTASAVYTYHEKKKDSKYSGWGSTESRLSKESIKEFDCCSLTLQPCREPVVTKDGHLYDREAILECLLHQKQQIAKKLKAYEKQLAKEQKEKAEDSQSSSKEKVQKFLKLEGQITTKRENPFSSVDEAGPSKKIKESKDKEASASSGGKGKESLVSFWIPSLTPSASADIVKKPENKTFCPMSGKPLKVKDLIPVKFTLAPDEDKKSLIAKRERYICPVTHDVLSNIVPSAVLKPSGHVVSMKCVDKFIKKDWICPITGKKLSESDIIELQRGGTGFVAASGEKIQSKVYGPTMITG